MTDQQVAIKKTDELAVANREVESEETEDTTLTEVHKDLGHTQITEKKAEFQSEKSKTVKEDNKTELSHSTKEVVQSESQEISENRKVFSTSFSSSQSFSMESTEEYEIEG